jgi:hypothetical protein
MVSIGSCVDAARAAAHERPQTFEITRSVADWPRVRRRDADFAATAAVRGVRTGIDAGTAAIHASAAARSLARARRAHLFCRAVVSTAPAVRDIRFRIDASAVVAERAAGNAFDLAGRHAVVLTIRFGFAGDARVRRRRADGAACAAVLNVRIDAHAASVARFETEPASNIALSGDARGGAVRYRWARIAALAAMRRVGGNVGAGSLVALFAPARAAGRALRVRADLVHRARLSATAAMRGMRAGFDARFSAARESRRATEVAGSLLAAWNAVHRPVARVGAFSAVRRVGVGIHASATAR